MSTPPTFGPNDFQMPTAHWAASLASRELPLPAMLGQYQLTEVLGHGGMGSVYAATHTKLKRKVAVKVLAPHRVHDPHSVARFHKEMEAIGRLDHPQIVRAVDAGDALGLHFLVMEYVDGIDMQRLLRYGGPMAIADACEVIRQAALGLAYVNEHQLVHRDVKPSNLMLSTAGQVKLLDLGLARLAMEEESSDAPLTATGEMMGTADFMAPEQGLDSHTVDIRADIYSLGCTLYMLLTGKPPYGLPHYDTKYKKLLAHSQKPVPSLREGRSDISSELEAIVLKMMAKLPNDRYVEPGEVAVALATFAAGSELRTLAVSFKERFESTLSEAETEVSLRDLWDTRQGVTPTSLSSGSNATRALLQPGSTVPMTTERARRRHRLWWLAGSAILLAAGVAAWLAITGMIFPRPEKSDSAPVAPVADFDSLPVPPELPEVGKKYRLSLREPERLMWPENPNWEDLRYDPDSKSLHLMTKNFGVLGLGASDLKELEYTFEITLEQVPWHGQVGIFFGYHECLFNGRPATRFQALMVNENPERGLGKSAFVLERYLHTIDHEDATQVPVRLFYALPLPNWRTSENRIGVTVRANDLLQIHVNGEILAGRDSLASLDRERVDPYTDTGDYPGAFGIYCNITTVSASHASVTFHKRGTNVEPR